MKNLDRIYGLTKSQVLLDELSCQINLDYFVRSQSNQLVCMYKDKKTSWDESDSDYIVRAAIFVASKLKYAGNDNLGVINLSNILKDLPNFHEFMVKFKDFIVNINVDPRVKSDMQSIISSYAFSLTLYNKYEEIWNTFQFADEEVKNLKKIGWCMFLLSRVNLIQRRSEIVECACMLLAVIYLIVTTCSLQCFKAFQKDEQEFLKSLSFMIKGQADQIRISATHLKKMLELFIHHKVVESDSGVQGVFKPENIKQNYEKLNLEYFHKLLPSEFDQRLFVENPKNFDFSQSRSFVFKKILRYEFPTVLQTSELYEIGVKEKSFDEQNLETWLKSFVNGKEIPLTWTSSLESLKTREKIENVIQAKPELLYKLSSKLFEIENLPDACDEVSLILASEILKFIYKIKTPDLKELICWSKVSAFDLWKKFQCLSVIELPKPLWQHIKEQQLLLSTSLVWQEKKTLNSFKAFLISKKDSFGPEWKNLISEILFYSSFVIKEISKLLYISERLQEDIWGTFKSSIMTETDILYNRNIHQIIICAIYGLCKAQNSNVPFNSIITSFIEIDPSSENLFRKLQIEETTGDIIKYYNEEYLKYMKSYLLAIARNCPKDLFTPFGVSNGPLLLSSNNESSCIGSNNFSNKTRKMYEFGETPESLNSFNLMIARNNKHFLSFDEEKMAQPVKRHKIMEEILQGEDIVENLPEDFPGFKED